jgi:cellulose biosynthesis protein BcsQ
MSSNKGNNMVNQKIKVYTIHSQKGGAGKTSIAIAIAGLSCILHKQKTLIIDCDLTGTSIIDLFYGVDKNNKAKENIKYLNSLLLATPSVFNKYENNLINMKIITRTILKKNIFIRLVITMIYIIFRLVLFLKIFRK